MSDWIRAKDVTSFYPVSRRYVTDLLRQFRAEEDDWIKDGKVLLIKKDSFEEWWKQHGRRKSDRKQAQGSNCRLANY